MDRFSVDFIDKALNPVFSATVGRVTKPGNQHYLIVKVNGEEFHQNHDLAILYATKEEAQKIAKIINQGLDPIESKV